MADGLLLGVPLTSRGKNRHPVRASIHLQIARRGGGNFRWTVGTCALQPAGESMEICWVKPGIAVAHPEKREHQRISQRQARKSPSLFMSISAFFAG